MATRYLPQKIKICVYLRFSLRRPLDLRKIINEEECLSFISIKVNQEKEVNYCVVKTLRSIRRISPLFLFS